MTSLAFACTVFLLTCFRPVDSQVDIDMSTCGTAKGCWYNSSSACDPSNCPWFVSYAIDPSGANVNFELSGQIVNSTNAYFAMALSPSGTMGSNGTNYYAVMCYNSNGQWYVANGYIFIRGFVFGTNNLVNTSASYNSTTGIVSCTFARSRQPTNAYDDLTSSSTAFYFLAATGRLTASTPVVFQHHVIHWSSLVVPQPSSPVNLASYPFSSASSGNSTGVSACSSTSGCWLSNPGCTQQTCAYMLLWTPNSAANYVTLQLSAIVPATATPYVTMAFSSDNMMGDDYTIGCWWNGSAVIVQDGYTMGGPNRGHRFISPSNVGVTVVGTSYNMSTNVLGCSFNRSLTPAGNQYALSLTSGNSNYLFIAIGPTTMPDYGFTEHLNAYVSNSPVDVTVVGAVSQSGTPSITLTLYRTHSSLMIFAWMLAMPLGALVGRHYRITLALKSSAGNKVWFQLHRSLQIIGLITTVAGFVIIFVAVGGYSARTTSPGYTHPIIGITLTAITIINVLIGIGGPGRTAQNQNRGRVLRFFHFVFGHSAIVLSCANNLVAILMLSPIVPIWLLAFPIAFFAVHLFTNILLEFHASLLKVRKESNNDTEFEQDIGHENPLGIGQNSSTSQIDANNFKLSRRNPGDAAPYAHEVDSSPADSGNNKSSRPAKRKSMINNSFRKTVLGIYAAIIIALTAAYIALLIIY